MDCCMLKLKGRKLFVLIGIYRAREVSIRCFHKEIQGFNPLKYHPLPIVALYLNYLEI